MQKERIRKALSCILCMVLIVAMALFTMACSGNSSAGAENGTKSAVGTTASEENGAAGIVAADGEILGEGSKSFAFTVVDKDGNETRLEIHTDKTLVGEALEELGLLIGEEGPYGLYVNVVNGITADYDVDGTYWAFYVNGTYGTTGVDQTEIEEGAAYSFKVEK